MALIDSVIQGGVGIASGIIGHKKRVQEQKDANAMYDANLAKFQNLDTSNPYANLQNTAEDLTVNTQQADFQAQQQNMGIANTMSAMQGAAGGSGIAALAQSLANAQTQNAQQASASIGQQEASNQAAAVQQAGRNQIMERKGELESRHMERTQAEGMLGIAQARKGAADLARQEATQAIIGGVGSIAGAAIKSTPAYAAQIGLGSRIGNALEE
jgi:hypothetical protein